MTPVKVWQERVEIPTYETGPQDIHPMFLENRVYQGSSGAVYPYGVTDTLSEQKTLKSWQAVWLENDYIKVMILPELGGRVHRAWDKVKQRDFVITMKSLNRRWWDCWGRGSPAGLSLTGRNTIARPPLCPLISPSKPMTTAHRRCGSAKRSRCTVYR